MNVTSRIAVGALGVGVAAATGYRVHERATSTKDGETDVERDKRRDKVTLAALAGSAPLILLGSSIALKSGPNQLTRALVGAPLMGAAYGAFLGGAYLGLTDKQ